MPLVLAELAPKNANARLEPDHGQVLLPLHVVSKQQQLHTLYAATSCLRVTASLITCCTCRVKSNYTAKPFTPKIAFSFYQRVGTTDTLINVS
jgi:hypothetical protein